MHILSVFSMVSIGKIRRPKRWEIYSFLKLVPLGSDINQPNLEKDEELEEVKFKLEETVDQLHQVQTQLKVEAQKLQQIQEADAQWFPTAQPREIWQWIIGSLDTLFWLAMYKLFLWFTGGVNGWFYQRNLQDIPIGVRDEPPPNNPEGERAPLRIIYHPPAEGSQDQPEIEIQQQ